jgi:hypothetical protein
LEDLTKEFNNLKTRYHRLQEAYVKRSEVILKLRTYIKLLLRSVYLLNDLLQSPAEISE